MKKAFDSASKTTPMETEVRWRTEGKHLMIDANFFKKIN